LYEKIKDIEEDEWDNPTEIIESSDIEPVVTNNSGADYMDQYSSLSDISTSSSESHSKSGNNLLNV